MEMLTCQTKEPAKNFVVNCVTLWFIPFAVYFLQRTVF